MAIWDGLNAQANSTMGRVGSMMEINRLNSVIANEERNISNYYYEIGKQYVTRHPQDYDAEYAQLIAAIREIETRIDGYRRQILALKGVQLCPQCGAEVPINAAYCNHCGYKMPEYIPAGMIKCTNCGQLVREGTRFCTRCGTPITAQPVEQGQPADQGQPVEPIQPLHPVQPVQPVQPDNFTQPVEPVGPAAEPQEQPQAGVCPHCGAQVTPDMLFCVECGAKLQ